jgi:hypothetical protein
MVEIINMYMETIILASSFMFSVFLYLKNRSYGFENSLNDRLFQIQKLSFDNPFLEAEQFISKWDEFSKKYKIDKNIDYDDKDIKKFLQYEQYCEMIFNLISDSYTYSKKEEKLLELIDFKSWTRTHKTWWNNPLVEHSNRDTYGSKLADILDNWMK